MLCAATALTCRRVICKANYCHLSAVLTFRQLTLRFFLIVLLPMQLSKAVKQLSCKHRLVLTGTPIQNNVLELWSLFDFLMPGFLGTEREFQAAYGRPILQSRDAKSSAKDKEAGI